MDGDSILSGLLRDDVSSNVDSLSGLVEQSDLVVAISYGACCIEAGKANEICQNLSKSILHLDFSEMSDREAWFRFWNFIHGDTVSVCIVGPGEEAVPGIEERIKQWLVPSL